MSDKFQMGTSMTMGDGTEPAPALQGFEGAAPTAAPAVVKDVTTQSFMADVIETSNEVPVLVDFWAPWCGPCKQLGPVIERVVAEQKGRVVLAKMDTEAHPQIAAQMGIQSIPAVVAFVDGRPADAFMGNQPETQVRAFVEKVATMKTSPAEEEAAMMLEAARAMEANGDLGGAMEGFGRLAQMNPDDAEALAGLGRVYVAAGEIDHARALLEQLPDDLRSKEPLAALETQLNLAAEADDVGELDDLRTAVETSPDDPQARIDYAVALNAANRREDAAEQLVEAFRRDREWNEGAAKAKLLEFFEAWGFKDPATVQGRRKLSSVMFS